VAKATKKEASPKLLKIKQIKSGVGRPETHRKTLRALGLKHQHTVVQKDNPAVRGMLFQVRHLVEVSEMEGDSK
jgi:large subunit ribosomal protein L30